MSVKFKKNNYIISINELEKIQKLRDKRGWGGERPREVNYKLGFPLYTSVTDKTLKNGQRLFKCPFPICRINPHRSAIISNNSIKKCFTCGIKENELDKFGKKVNFECGHLKPHILGGQDLLKYQCKWCNTFYKDKITWNSNTNKPKFNILQIIRDTSKIELRKILKQLNYTAEDLF